MSILKEKLYINGNLVFPSIDDAAAAYRESYLEMAQEKLVQAINNRSTYFRLPPETPLSIIDEIRQNGFSVDYRETFNDGYVFQVSGWSERIKEEDKCYENNI